MENLLPSGIAAPLARDNDLPIWPHSLYMKRTPNIAEGIECVESAIRTIANAPDSLISQLTAPERVIVKVIKDRYGVRA